jgi:AraC-like DNA-binding protein
MTGLPDFLLARPDLLSSIARQPGKKRRCFRWSMTSMSTDVLSELLSAVRLNGSVFFDVTARSPWVAEAPPSAKVAGNVTPGAQHAIEYHVVTSGSCWISLVDDDAFEPVRLSEGDVAVVPHGDGHALSSEPGMRAEPQWELHQRPADENALPFKLTTGSKGPGDAHLICGFFSCDLRPFNPLLDSLPPFIRCGRGASIASDGLLHNFIHFAKVETNDKRAGSQSILNRLSELMFVEVIRRHMDQLDDNNTGWLAGLRNPLVARALTLLHGLPAHAWTLDDLAAEVGASRSVLAERFAHLTGYSPIQYLTQWRMQVAAKQLTETNAKVAAVANAVGYDSEAAFSRAFKKVTGRSPTEWRSNHNALLLTR